MLCVKQNENSMGTERCDYRNGNILSDDIGNQHNGKLFDTGSTSDSPVF